MNPQHFQDVIDGTLSFVEVASFGMKKACDEITVHRSMQKRASVVAPDVLTLMLKTGAVTPAQKEEAAAMLGDHASTLGLLKNAVEELAKARAGAGSKKAGDLGKGEDEKIASDRNGSGAGNYLGRKTSDIKDSDRAILAVLEPPSR